MVPGRRARGFIGLLDGLAMHLDKKTIAGEAKSYLGKGQIAEAFGAAVGESWAHLTVLNRKHVLLGLG
jgi:hypothetical protein